MNERDRLLKLNRDFISLPMTDLNKLSNEELQKRADMFKNTFEAAFSESDDKDEDL